MILLPHGCSCSQPSVTPKNWEKGPKSLMNRHWRIHYYFRDPEFKDQYPYGKLITIKGMNKYKTIEERRAATKILIEEELYVLQAEGYNPITKKNNGTDIVVEYDISPETLILIAIEEAKKKIQAAKSTQSDLKTVVKYFSKSCRQLRYNILKIGDVKKIHIKNILENQAKQNNYTNERFNKVRAYIQMVFEELVDSDALDYNLISSIKKKKETKKIKKVLNDREHETVRDYLKQNHYTFYRYFEIFFRSGSRSTELFNLRYSDVELYNQRFKVLVKKGKHYEEQWRAINNNAMPFWMELMASAEKGDYIFSYNFSPGKTKIAARQVSNKWRKYVKQKMGITADFYSMKHLYTTKVISLYSRDLATGINGHKSRMMNDKHYDTLYNERKLEEAKNINVK